MTAINPSDYFKRKADVSNLKKAITDQQAEIESLRRRLSETQTHVNDINAKLAIEERELSRPGAFSKVTLSKEQFNDHKPGSRYFCESFYGPPSPTSGKNYATANACGCPSRPGHSIATQQGVAHMLSNDSTRFRKACIFTSQAA
ncbi:hypothetical protein [Methylobacter sp.]|uniref:hypothetical protein n=1 Tax=Methylobacter sp. TaxID=2051955 RepID=UPI002FDE7280